MKTEPQNAIAAILREPNHNDTVLFCLSPECECMLDGAVLVRGDGKTENFAWLPRYNEEKHSNEVAIGPLEGHDEIVAFHESRRSSKTGRPNGIRVHDGELFSRAVFLNVGNEPLTVDGDWLKPGETVTYEEQPLDNPEVQKALRALCNSEKVLEDVEAVRREAAEKEGLI